MEANERTVSFTYAADGAVRRAAFLADVKLVDQTVEVGHYDRTAYSATLEAWNKIFVVLSAVHSVAKGSNRRIIGAALNRIPRQKQQ